MSHYYEGVHTYTIRVGQGMHDETRSAAAELGVSVNALVRRAVEEYIDTRSSRKSIV